MIKIESFERQLTSMAKTLEKFFEDIEIKVVSNVDEILVLRCHHIFEAKVFYYHVPYVEIEATINSIGIKELLLRLAYNIHKAFLDSGIELVIKE